MQNFLEKVADHVLSNYSTGLHNTCIITPNRRSGLFLKKHFAARVKGAIWATDILCMEDFISKITHLTIQEPVALLLDFYHVYQQQEKENAESLDEFMKWATMLIKDFNDLDAGLSEPQQLFSNVLDIKRIENWNPDGSPPTEFQQKYITFFSRFINWHAAFSEYLLSRNTAYQGLAYRIAADYAASDNPVLPWENICFAGFNALNQAEETIIRSLVKRGVAEVLWDADKYYLSNSNHEAGLFLRKYKNQWGLKDFSFIGDHFSFSHKNINLYGVARNVNQAKLAANLLSSFPAEDIKGQNTAIVLANEDLLIPVLNSIPSHIGKINITMGLPLRKTSAYAIFDALFQLHVTTLRMKSAGEGMTSAFYFKDIVRFFRHPAVALILEQHSPQMTPEKFINRIYQTKKTFLYFQTLCKLWDDEDFFHQKFSPFFEGFAQNPTGIVNAMLALSSLLSDTFKQQAVLEDIDVEQAHWFTDFEALYTINTILRKLDLFLEQQAAVNDLKMLFMLFQSMARESKLVLSGEPLAGLQIMGMLETRNLDFKNLIILSANEDILPVSKSNNSLIPYDVKVHFGLPVNKEKDALYAYHFYRLLQRAENIHIIYNTQTQDIGSSEKSRFLTQLQMEMPVWNKNIVITEKIVSLPSARIDNETELSVPKTEAILQSLNAINEKGFSPTTLIHYITCPMLFYFKHVAGIHETAVPEETIQANTLGTVVHEVMEQLYDDEKLTGEIVSAQAIDRMLGRVEQVTKLKFSKVYNGGDISTGKNLLLTKVATKYVKNYLSWEKTVVSNPVNKNIPLLYIKAEEQLVADIPMTIGNEIKPIKFRGFADRIDKLGDTLRIIDYKTGKVEKDELKFSDWNDLFTDSGKGKSFQLLMYSMLYQLKNQNVSALSPGIISFRSPRNGMYTVTCPEGNNDGIIDNKTIATFEDNLQELVKDIFNLSIPFTPASNEKNCTRCDFRVACNR